MYIFLGIILALLLLIIFILCHKWKITVIYKDGAATFRVGVFRFSAYGNKKKKKKDDDYIKIPKMRLGDIKKKGKIIRDIYRDEKHEIIAILQEIERRIEFERVNFALTFGFGDAAVTGIANGILWRDRKSVV